MKTHWQIYKELEQIPDSVSAPQANNSVFVWGLSQAWRSLLGTLAKKPLHEQQIESLERSFAIDCTTKNSDIWGKVWTFLNQPLVLPRLSNHSEPQVWQSFDRDGHTWWHVYDPITGRTANLDSEEEVCMWLEERPYF
jgi:hypothetical protein